MEDEEKQGGPLAANQDARESVRTLIKPTVNVRREYNDAVTRELEEILSKNDGDWPDKGPVILSRVRDGANPNGPKLLHAPILYSACKYDDLEAVTCLLEHGADPNTVHGDIFTPLTATNSEAVLQLLVDYGADLNWRTPGGKSGLLHRLVSCFKNPNLLRKCCYELGCNVHAVTRNGQTPLHEICDEWSNNGADVTEKICILLNVGADLRREDSFGVTPLQMLEKSKPSLVVPVCALEEQIKKARANRLRDLSPLHMVLALHLQSLDIAQMVTNYSHEIMYVSPPELTPEQKSLHHN